MPDEPGTLVNQPNVTVVVTSDETELVVSGGGQGPPGVADEDVARAKRTDIREKFNGIIADPDFTTIYIGEAQVGVVDSTATWRIRRLIIDDSAGADGDVTQEWAENGGIATADEIFVWDNRLALTYS
jgi:hypothetical protein